MKFVLLTCFVAAWSALAHSASAQIVRLPSGIDYYEEQERDAPPDRPHALLAGYPSELSQPLLPEGQPSAGPVLPNGVLGGDAVPNPWASPATVPSAEPPLPKGAKPGVFQQLLFAETYLPRNGTDGFGMNDVLLQATFGFPLPNRANPLLITPAYEVQFLDGPSSNLASQPFQPVPSQLTDASVQFLHLRKISARWSINVVATPGWHSDLQQGDHRAFRLPGRILGLWDWKPNLQLIFGVLYLDRQDVMFLPAGGIIWNPNEEQRLELIFPRPRYTQRFVYEGDIEWWWYVAGEFGGGSYAVERVPGTSDVLTLSDWRVLLGVERRVTAGINSRFEIGYVFNRKLEYESSPDIFKPDSTFLVRGGLTY